MSNKERFSAGKKTLVALVAGLLLITIGAGYTYFSYTFTRTAITTNGTVTYVKVNKNRKSGGGTSVTYTPTISFNDKQGAPLSAKVSEGSSSYNFPIGTEMSIRYNPDDPNQMALNTWFALWGIGTIFLTAGFGTIAYLVFAWRDSKKPGEARKRPGDPTDDLNNAAAFLRKMGRDAEADEIVKSMRSPDLGARNRDQ